MTGFLRHNAHSVGECQRRTIVGEKKASRNSPAFVAEFPIVNFHKIAYTFAPC